MSVGPITAKSCCRHPRASDMLDYMQNLRRNATVSQATRQTSRMWTNIILRQCLIGTWAEIQQSTINDAVDQSLRRLHAFIPARGGHFE